MQLTTHAAKQARRRGINIGLIDHILQYGEEYKGGGGCSLYRISAKEQRFLKSENPQGWKNERDHRQVALVIKGDVLITAMHRVKPLKRTNRLV